jgi:hypothetical protein
MPAIAILASVAIAGVWQAAPTIRTGARWPVRLAAAFALLAATWWHFGENFDFYFRKSVEHKVAFEFAQQGPDAFLSAEYVAEYVRSITDEDEEILVWAGEAEIYYLADRRSASRYINTGKWFLERERTVAHDVSTKRPRVVVAYNDKAGVLWNPDVAPFLRELGYVSTRSHGWLTVFELRE